MWTRTIKRDKDIIDISVPKIAELVESSISVLYLSANMVVIVAVGIAHNNTSSFAMSPLIPKTNTNAIIKAGWKKFLREIFNKTFLLNLITKLDMINPSANKDTPEVDFPISVKLSFSTEGRDKPE